MVKYFLWKPTISIYNHIANLYYFFYYLKPVYAAENPLVKKLPNDAAEKDPSSEVVVNICGILNNLVMQSYDSAKTLTDNGGLVKLMNIKTTADDDCRSVTCISHNLNIYYLTNKLTSEFVSVLSFVQSDNIWWIIFQLWCDEKG